MKCEQAESQDPPSVPFSHLKGQVHTIKICIKKSTLGVYIRMKSASVIHKLWVCVLSV